MQNQNSNSNPQPLGDLLKNIVRKARPSRVALSRRRLAQKILSEELKEQAAHASVASVKVGVVTIDTDSSALFQELEGFQRGMLIERFRAGGLNVRELRVRLLSNP